MPNYGDATYWDQRYKEKNTTFDWLEQWINIKFKIESFVIPNKIKLSEENLQEIRKDLKVLNLGCGNSILSEDMYDDGYKSIWNMDISPVCIDQMKQRN